MSTISWAELQQTTMQRGEFQVIDTGISVPAGNVLAALDAKGCQHLLAPIAGASPIIEDNTSRGVHLKDRRLLEADAQYRFLDAACQHPRWNGLFTVLAEEMLAELTQEPSPIRAWRKVLSRWRDLLDREPSAALTREALIGLFGELWVLEQLLANAITSLAAWKGPLGARHDFRGERHSLEVKTTLRREGWEAEVHGAEQLLAPETGNLWLICVRLSEEASGQNLIEQIETVQNLTDPAALYRLLAALGYSTAEADRYNEPRLKVTEVRAFAVTDDFPKIVPASFAGGALPERILQMRYRIDLNGYPYSSYANAVSAFQDQGE